MRRLLVSAMVCYAALTTVTAVNADTSQPKPNVLLIMADDQAFGMTGFEGHAQIKTPNLDKLASEGVYFSRCYAPTPQCAPMRATVLTGLYPHSHGVTTNGNANNPMALPINADTISYRMKRAGYACGLVGKWHLSYSTAAQPGFGFIDYTATHDGEWSWQNSKVFVQGKETKADKHLTEWNADRAIECIDQLKEKPFFLWLNFRSPHAPLDGTLDNEQTYPSADIKLPETRNVDANTAFPRKVRNAPPVEAYKKMTEQQLKQARSKYYAMVANIDANVGRVLTRLDELELADKTIVIFCSDNGWALGDHALYTKGPFFYDEMIRMPLVIRYPGKIKKDAKIERVVSFVDLAPTILDLAGLKPSPVMQGQSLVGLIDNPQRRDHPDECFLEYDEQKGQKYPVRGIIYRHLKFIDYLGEQNDVLFNLNKDPQEMTNLAQNPDYESTVTVLRKRINMWRKNTSDPLMMK